MRFIVDMITNLMIIIPTFLLLIFNVVGCVIHNDILKRWDRVPAQRSRKQPSGVAH